MLPVSLPLQSDSRSRFGDLIERAHEQSGQPVVLLIALSEFFLWKNHMQP
jgi:hypothetical protein